MVPGARFQCGAMECFDLLAILCRERQVQVRRPLFDSADAQRGLSVRAELDAERPFRNDGDADRFECLEEERPARRIVAGPEYDVIEHASS
ncbi:hypothetical protein [Oleiagrimonas citrea]|uniref:hypothetical protein n=1 Tax=Oleiagrimonas citrea TaxID=1665687 RepID=UPI0019625265